MILVGSYLFGYGIWNMGRIYIYIYVYIYICISVAQPGGLGLAPPSGKKRKERKKPKKEKERNIYKERMGVRIGRELHAVPKSMF